MKKRILGILCVTFMVCISAMFSLTAFAGNGKRPTKISAVGSKTKTVTQGSEFELKVKANNDDDYLRWTITGTKGIIAFEDDDRNDDEVEFHALKTGTTKVTCTIKGTSKKVTYTVKVTTPKYSAKTQKISASGSTKVTITVGQEKKLKVKKASKVKDNYLKWTISGTKGVVVFDDDDIYDDDIEIKACKAGTAKVICTNMLTNKKVTYTVTVKNKTVKYSTKTHKITRSGPATVKIEVGEDEELEVKKTSNVKDNHLKWTITSGKNIIAFDDNDIYDDDIEIIGLKVGTAKVTCTNLKTKQKITYTIKVVARR